jgi:hypothetical protein
MRVHIDSLYSGQEFYQLTAPHQATLRWERMIVFEILATVLIADFASGLFHWMEDAYGKADWPVTGSLITKPNILHHHDPRHFTRNNWFESSWLLLCICGSDFGDRVGLRGVDLACLVVRCPGCECKSSS